MKHFDVKVDFSDQRTERTEITPDFVLRVAKDMVQTTNAEEPVCNSNHEILVLSFFVRIKINSPA